MLDTREELDRTAWITEAQMPKSSNTTKPRMADKPTGSNYDKAVDAAQRLLMGSNNTRYMDPETGAALAREDAIVQVESERAEKLPQELDNVLNQFGKDRVGLDPTAQFTGTMSILGEMQSRLPQNPSQEDFKRFGDSLQKAYMKAISAGNLTLAEAIDDMLNQYRQ